MPQIYIGIAALPLGLILVGLPLASGGSTQRWLWPLQALTFACTGLLAALRWLRWPSATPKWLIAAVCLAVAASASSTATSADLDASIPEFVRWVWLGSLMILALHLLTAAWGTKLLGGLALGGVVLQASVAMFDWWGGGNAASTTVGTFYAPNQFAGYLLVASPIAVSLMVRARAPGAGVLWGVLGASIYSALVLSGSRGGMVAAGIGVLVVMAASWTADPLRVVRRTILFVAGIAALLFLLAGPALTEPVEGPLTAAEIKPDVDIGLGIRGQWVVGAIRVGSTDPLTGTGLGTFGDKLTQLQDPSWRWSRYAHNDYAEAFAEGGLPLAAAVIAIPLLALGTAFRDPSASVSTEATIRIGLSAGVAGAALHRLIDHDWSFPAYSATFIIAVTVVAVSGGGQHDVPRTLRRAKWPVAVGGLALAIVWGLASYGTVLADHAIQAGGSRMESIARSSVRFLPFATRPRVILSRALASKDPPDIEAAVKALREAGWLDRLDASLRWELAGHLARSGRLDDARRSYSQAIKLAPNSARAWGLAGEFEVRSSKYSDAIDLLDEGISRLLLRPDQDRTAASIANLYLLRSIATESAFGNHAALVDVANALTLAPDSPTANLRAAELRCAVGDNDGASRALKRAQELGVEPESAHRVATLIAGGC